jgi:hypothetical protein
MCQNPSDELNFNHLTKEIGQICSKTTDPYQRSLSHLMSRGDTRFLQEDTALLTPWVFHPLIDVSGSAESDIPIIRTTMEQIINHLHLRHNPRDLMRLSCFSGYKGDCLQIKSTPGYFQTADRQACDEAILQLRQWKSRGATAIYDSVRCVHQDILYQIDRIAYPSLNVLLLITDGDDNESVFEPEHMGFPNSRTLLAVIGVGSHSLSSLETLSPYAKFVYPIASFEELLSKLSIVMEKIYQCVLA